MSRIWRKPAPNSRNLDASNPAPSEPNVGGTDLVISAMESSLSALKELSSLAKMIPYISPAAGLILQALKMCDVSTLFDIKSSVLMVVYKEVKQCKEEWKLVMEKLAKVGSFVVNIGNMCRNHGLKVEELPSDLLAIYESFQRCPFSY
jgi:hypothetical protein